MIPWEFVDFGLFGWGDIAGLDGLMAVMAIDLLSDLGLFFTDLGMQAGKQLEAKQALPQDTLDVLVNLDEAH